MISLSMAFFCYTFQVFRAKLIYIEFVSGVWGDLVRTKKIKNNHLEFSFRKMRIPQPKFTIGNLAFISPFGELISRLYIPFFYITIICPRKHRFIFNKDVLIERICNKHSEWSGICNTKRSLVLAMRIPQIIV
jgi:hypothetical protein